MECLNRRYQRKSTQVRLNNFFCVAVVEMNMKSRHKNTLYFNKLIKKSILQRRRLIINHLLIIHTKKWFNTQHISVNSQRHSVALKVAVFLWEFCFATTSTPTV